jgi:hypothetical protein
MKGVVRAMSTVAVAVGNPMVEPPVLKKTVEKAIDSPVVESKLMLVGLKYMKVPVAVAVGTRLKPAPPYPPKYASAFELMPSNVSGTKVSLASVG